MFRLGLPELLILLIVVFTISLFWKIFSKAGFSGWLALGMIVPLLNFALLVYLAWAEWPVQRELRRLKQGQS